MTDHYLSVLGVDPGHRGAAVVVRVLRVGAIIVNVNIYRNAGELDLLFSHLRSEEWNAAFIEQQRIVFGQKGALTTATNYGQWLGFLKAYNENLTIVAPAHWQRTVHGHSTSVKKETIEWAKKMFERDKLSDGEADALGIAWHGVMQTMSKQ